MRKQSTFISAQGIFKYVLQEVGQFFFSYEENYANSVVAFVKEYTDSFSSNETKLMNCLRLIKDCKISFTRKFYFSYLYKEIYSIRNDRDYDSHCFLTNNKFFLTDSEIITLNNLYDNFNEHAKEKLSSMLALYNQTFGIQRSMMEPLGAHLFIPIVSLITILEMFIDSNTEVGYKTARTMAVYLGRTKIESESIFKTVKEFYDLRSKFVHEGLPPKFVKARNAMKETHIKYQKAKQDSNQKEMDTLEKLMKTQQDEINKLMDTNPLSELVRRALLNYIASDYSIHQIETECHKNGSGENPMKVAH